MRIIRTLMCLWMAACVGTLVCGCTGEKAMEVQTVSDSSNLSPEEKILKAAGAGDMTTLKSLVESDAALVKARGFRKITPLHAAAAEGQSSAVTFLLEHGADAKAVDEESSSAVNTAFAAGHKATAKIIEDWIAKGGSADPK